MYLYSITFYIFSLVAVLSALMVISARNPVHSVLFLILSFVNVKVSYFLAFYLTFFAFIERERVSDIVCEFERVNGKRFFFPVCT